MTSTSRFIDPIDNSYVPERAHLSDTFAWLRENPDFEFKPATMREFLGPGYLDIDADLNPELNEKGSIRPGVRDCLVDIFGEEINPERFSVIQRELFTGGIGIGKGQRVDDLVCTPKGWREIGSLSVGDFVIGSDGRPTEVTGVFPRGILPMYRVTLTDGSFLEVDGDHLWTVQSPKQRYRASGWKTMSTAELMAAGVTSDRGQRQWHIPLVDHAVQYEGLDSFDVQPYTLGALLGDGGLTQKSVVLTTVDAEILDEVTAEISDQYAELHVRQKGNCSYIFTHGKRGVPNRLYVELQRLGVTKHSWLKRIPETYLRASAVARRRLLRGLMDTDGWHNPNVGYTEFCSTSEGLARDVAELVRSLGGVAKIKHRDDTGGRRAYLVAVRTNFNPFHLSRKREAWAPNAKYKPTRMIASIEPVEPGEVVCIQVAAEDHLYVAKDHIVTHNSTMASVALPYMIHWVGCLYDPQAYFGLMKGTKIAFMLMSTSRPQAIEVLFGDVKSRLESSNWFNENFKPNTDDKNLKNKLKFPKNIWLLPGSSKETSFEGYNILGGVIDEADSHQVTERTDYADVGFETIENRISSRFPDPEYGDYRGLLIVIGQKKTARGFVARKEKDFADDPHAAVHKMTIWESRGWEYYRSKKTGEIEVFYFDKVRKEIIPSDVARMFDNDQVIPIPMVYFKDFDMNPVKALKDHAGIPPEVESPFIPNVLRIEECMARWEENNPELAAANLSGRPLVSPDTVAPTFGDDLYCGDNLKRVIHIDVAYSGDATRADALGMAMAHVSHIVDDGGDLTPYIKFDFLLRMKAPIGGEIILADVRQMIYELKFVRGYNVALVTLDGIESLDTVQSLNKKKIPADKLSVDKTKGPYEDLRESILGRTCEFPRYYTYVSDKDHQKSLIAINELSQLEDVGRKIDHPAGGSKDVADAMAGCTHILMGSPQMRRGLKRIAAQGLGDPLSSPNTGSYDELVAARTEKIPAAAFGAGQVIDELGAPASRRSLNPLAGRIALPSAGGRRGWAEPEKDPFGLSRR